VGGRLIAGAGCISLDRADDRQGLVVIRQVVRRIQAGEAIGIYPEGTRSKTGELLPFRVGCFKAAQWAKCPLVVLRTRGTENIGKNFFLRRTPVTLTVAAVFPYEQIRDLDTTEIGELVREVLTSNDAFC
jgi:1-acyl-sn-glycerol-3-phosphate acyltransferase